MATTTTEPNGTVKISGNDTPTIIFDFGNLTQNQLAATYVNALLIQPFIAGNLSPTISQEFQTLMNKNVTWKIGAGTLSFSDVTHPQSNTFSVSLTPGANATTSWLGSFIPDPNGVQVIGIPGTFQAASNGIALSDG